ncbi:hypothetical protein WH96_18975 [Kiloniella spongiae]|uniref:Uncharacterized protein n=1 Tax=Kiloniella spongiae TaxID=1489064 RepID=A0A0H2MRB6_9PROT|nr:hypothetical protein WH96_18975 [Kiloniella spongiae]
MAPCAVRLFEVRLSEFWDSVEASELDLTDTLSSFNGSIIISKLEKAKHTEDNASDKNYQIYSAAFTAEGLFG